MAVSETWTDPAANHDLSAGQKVTEIIWDAVMSNILYALRRSEAVLTNKSGGAASAGDVHVVDSANDSAMTTTTTLQHRGPVGVARESIGNNASGRYAFIGPATVKVTGTVARGDFLEPSTVAGSAKSVGAYPTAWSFARALTADSGGYCTALLLPRAGGDAAIIGSALQSWILPHFYSAENSMGHPTTNLVRAAKVYIPTGFYVATLQFNVSAAETVNWGAGLYALDGNTKLLDTGAVSTSSTGLKTVTLGTPVFVPAGLYWLAWTSNSNGGALRLNGTYNPNDALNNSGSYPMSVSAANAGVSGVLPATLGTLTPLSLNSAPMLKLISG